MSGTLPVSEVFRGLGSAFPNTDAGINVRNCSTRPSLERGCMEKAVLSIVIGTFNRLDLLRQCLSALIGKVHVEHEIVVVDAGSTDGTIDYLRDLQGVNLLLDGQRLGQARSLNRVFKNIKSKYICWLSDDNVVRPGILELSVSILEKDPRIGMVALKVKDVKGHNTSLPYIGGFWPSGILTCNQGLLPTRILNHLGGFDDDFRDYGIDADLTARVLMEGYKVVFTKSIAIHHFRDHASHTWIEGSEREKRISAGREYYCHKYKRLIAGKYDKNTGLYQRMLRGIRSFYRWTDSVHLPFRQRLNSLIQDWFFAYSARFISAWDSIKNYDRPYHLVQQMPADLIALLRE